MNINNLGDMNINFSLIFNGVNRRVLIMQSSF